MHYNLRTTTQQFVFGIFVTSIHLLLLKVSQEEIGTQINKQAWTLRCQIQVVESFDHYICDGQLFVLVSFLCISVSVTISVGIGSNASVIASLHVDHHIKCFSPCNHRPTCMGFKFKQQFSSGSEDNCILINNTGEDETNKEGEWIYYKSFVVSYCRGRAYHHHRSL